MRKHGAFCYGSKAENGSESPSPQPSPTARSENILGIRARDREQSGIVDEPVPLRQVGVVNPIVERMSNISGRERFPLPMGEDETNTVGHCQASNKVESLMRKHGSKAENGSESPSPQPSPNATIGNILHTCVGEREQSGIVDEPVPLREERTFD
jgi:hypothetical protein